MSNKRESLIDKISDFFGKEFRDKKMSSVADMKITAIEYLDFNCCMIKLKKPRSLLGINNSRLNRLEKFLNMKVYVIEDTSTEVYDEIIQPVWIDYEDDDDMSF